MMEDDDRDDEKSDSSVVVTLEGERWKHMDDTNDGRRGRRVEGLSRQGARPSLLIPDVVKAKRRHQPRSQARQKSWPITAVNVSAPPLLLLLLRPHHHGPARHDILPRPRLSAHHLGRKIGSSGIRQSIPHFYSAQLIVFPQFCSLYLRLFHSKLIARQQELKTTTWATKAQLMATSAQDHFAKWAKLKRSVDKGFQDLETTSQFPRRINHPSLNRPSFYRRFRNRISQNAVLHQVQFGPLVLDHWSSIFHRLVVQEITCVLLASGLVRPFDLVVGPSVGSCRFGKLWCLADGLQKDHPGD